LSIFGKLQKAASYLMFDKYKEMLSHLNKKDGDKLENYICSLPIVGFNSSFYDVGLLDNNFLMHEIYKRDQKPFIIKEWKQI